MLSNFSIGRRLTIGFALMNALIVAIGAAAILVTGMFVRTLDDINEKGANGAGYVSTVRDAVWQLRYGISQYIADPKSRPGVIADTPKWIAIIEENLGRFNAVERTAEERAAVAEFTEAYRKYVEARPKWLQLYGEGRIEEAAEWRAKTIFPFGGAMVSGLGKLVEAQRKASLEADRSANSLAALTRSAMIAAVIGAMGVGALLAWVLGRSITKPLGEAVQAARRVAAGDLSIGLHPRGRDEAAQLLRALSEMSASLSRLVGQVRLGTETIASAAAQIASGTSDLSQRTEEQAASLEETAASMGELTGTVQQNAENARTANSLAHSASDIAVRGGEAVSEVVQTMQSIEASSRKVVDIISVIDGISFQTNILALNAAVEAARAGDQGRGFAVVAAEVRSLAQRSAAAAKEIKALIDDSVGKVDAGSALVAQAGTTMQEIVGSIKRVTDVVDEISNASQEQTRGIEQVDQAIAQMDTVTQQNAGLVEQAAHASAALQEQAGALLEAVGLFRLPSDSEAAQVISALRIDTAKAVRERQPALPA